MIKLNHIPTIARLVLALLLIVSAGTALSCNDSAADDPANAIAIVFIDVASIEGHFIQLCLAGAENARQQRQLRA